MRHGNRNRKLSRPTDQRIAMLRSIVISLLQHGRVEVTVTRAKEARKMADRIINDNPLAGTTIRDALSDIEKALKVIRVILEKAEQI